MSVILADLIATYKESVQIFSSNTFIELEVILSNVSAAQFVNAYSALVKHAEKQPIQLLVDKVHNRMSDDKNIRHQTSRLTLIYKHSPDKTYQRVETVAMKKSRREPYVSDKYKVVLSTEEKINIDSDVLNDKSSSDIARIKVRNSFIWDKLPNWQIDITAVSQIKWSGRTDYLKNTIKSVFDSWMNEKNISVDKLSKFTSFEIEAEYIGNKSGNNKSDKNSNNKSDKNNDSTELTDKEIERVAIELLYIAQYGDKNESLIKKDEDIYDECSKLAQIISGKIFPNPTIKKIMNNPVELNVLNYMDIYPPLGWFITDKADGMHAVIFIYDGKLKVIIAGDALTIQPKKSLTAATTILDTEMVGNKFYVFDVIMLKDNNYGNFQFTRRVEVIPLAVEFVRDTFGIQIFAKPFKQFPIVVPETTSIYEEIRRPILEMFERQRDYEIDGLILNSPDATYKNTKMYKWKSETTIDFLAVKCPNGLLNKISQVWKLHFEPNALHKVI